jgi:hypothetical protein
MLVEDKRATVPDQVAAKIDVAAWFGTLTKRMRQIAKDLGVTRISLRRRAPV